MASAPYSPTFPAPPREPIWWVSVRLVDAAARVWLPVNLVGLEHVPRSGPALLATNHVSYLDPVVMLVIAHRAGRKMRGMATAEAFEKPVSGWFLRAGRHIPIAQGRTSALRAVRTATAALAAGEVVLIHPEGTIPKAGATAAEAAGARGGAGMLALTSGVPVIPIATVGFERGRRRPWQRRPGKVVIGAPVDLSAYAAGRGRERYEAASQAVLSAIRELRVQAAEVGSRR